MALGWGWALAIIWLSLTPAPPRIDVAQGDKLGHFAAYGLLMLWFCLLYQRRLPRIAYGAGFIAMGVGLEVIQGLLGYRTYDEFDMLANSIGVLLGWCVALLALRSERLKRVL